MKYFRAPYAQVPVEMAKRDRLGVNGRNLVGVTVGA